MIRTTLLWLFVGGFSIYAFKDWYKSLCALILLMAVIEHPDMPKTILGIPGLNPWNLLLLFVTVGWFSSRRSEGLKWDMPSGTTALLLLYGAVVAVGLLRMFADRSYLDEFTMADLVTEQVINTLKWVIPGLLLFDGCRSRERFGLGMLAVCGVYFLIGVQVIKWMPLDSVRQGGDLAARSLRILVNEVGYHRVNLSAMLAGGSWALLAASAMGSTRSRRWLMVAAGLSVAFAQALTGGRTGYATWGLIGLALGVLRWRGLLLMIPVGVAAVLVIVPGAQQRMFEGFSEESRDVNSLVEAQSTVSLSFDGDDSFHAYTITAGRSVAWPYVIDKIGESPLIGYGRLAMKRTGLERLIYERFQETFPHPHNAYLEWLLDNGILGFLIVIPFYLLMLARSLILLRDRRSPVFTAVGGMTASLLLALLIASVGSQTFYPREGWVGLWCSIGLMMRVAVERKRMLAVSAVPPLAFGRRAEARGVRVPEYPGRAAARSRVSDGVELDSALWSAAR